jgi:hypothetical protein
VLICVRQYVHRVVVIAALGLACSPTICVAQESTLALHTLTSLLGATPAPSISPANIFVVADDPAEGRYSSISHVTETVPEPRLGVLLPLYTSFAGLQMLDAHSTTRALQNGGAERNPLLGSFAGRPGALFALKAGVTASTILLAEKLRAKHRVGGILLMAALDSFYAMVVVHNYRAIP